MREFHLLEIAEITQGELSGVDCFIDNVSIDSRKIFNLKKTIFFAIRGQRNDGHDYIQELYLKGVRSFLVENLPLNQDYSDAGFVLCNDSLQALQSFATKIRKEFKGQLVGVTGSNGKTILKEWIFQALNQSIRLVRSPLSYNSQVGVPLSVFLLDEQYDLAVMEAGISMPGEMDKLQRILQPEIGIFTNIGDSHQENFESLEQKVSEKIKLFKDAEVLIYSRDHTLVHAAMSSLSEKVKTISWGKDENSDYKYNTISIQGKTVFNIEKDGEKFSISNRFNDSASIENLMHLFVFLHFKAYDPDFIQIISDKLERVGMRMELLKGMNNCTIINDSYNSDFISLSNALDVLNNQNQHKTKRLILSDILQSGREEELYKEVASLIASKGIDKFIGVGAGLNKFKHLFPPEAEFFYNTRELSDHLSYVNFKDEAILLKGSREFQFELISRVLEEKTHRTVLEINLTSLVENYQYFKSLVPKETMVMAMVKAFSYGSGGYEIANVLQYNKVDYLAVAFADEGVLLRKNGIHLPIMVMNPEKNDFFLMTEYRLEPEIYGFRILEDFNSYIEKSGMTDYPIHIKVDTGMKRLGFAIDDAEIISVFLKKTSLKIKSVFTHLSSADEEKHDDFTHKQVADFKVFCHKLSDLSEQKFLMHVLNSAGVERFAEYSFDMVRLGIGLYGISSTKQASLNEVSSFKTRIAQIRRVNNNETIGYNRKGTVERPSRIATLPVGYADGLPRILSNGRGSLKINNKFAPIVGNICMDMTMVDVTDILCEEGDEVLIFGKGFSVTELSKSAGTIPYEILTGISQRVKRIYYQD
jgi:Alr-MurF fusion protein